MVLSPLPSAPFLFESTWLTSFHRRAKGDCQSTGKAELPQEVEVAHPLQRDEKAERRCEVRTPGSRLPPLQPAHGIPGPVRWFPFLVQRPLRDAPCPSSSRQMGNVQQASCCQAGEAPWGNMCSAAPTHASRASRVRWKTRSNPSAHVGRMTL